MFLRRFLQFPFLSFSRCSVKSSIFFTKNRFLCIRKHGVKESFMCTENKSPLCSDYNEKTGVFSINGHFINNGHS